MTPSAGDRRFRSGDWLCTTMGHTGHSSVHETVRAIHRARCCALRLLLADDEPAGGSLLPDSPHPVKWIFPVVSPQKHWRHTFVNWLHGYYIRKAIFAPLVFATASTTALAAIQQQYGARKASRAVEALFSQLAAQLAADGVTRFIVAGGETSGVVTQSLSVTGFPASARQFPPVCPFVNAP